MWYLCFFFFLEGISAVRHLVYDALFKRVLFIVACIDKVSYTCWFSEHTIYVMSELHLELILDLYLCCMDNSWWNFNSFSPCFWHCAPLLPVWMIAKYSVLEFWSSALQFCYLIELFIFQKSDGFSNTKCYVSARINIIPS